MKTVLVTGANRGIGYEVARELGLRGFHVFVGAHDPSAGRAAAASTVKSGGNGTFLKIDVADNASVTSTARRHRSSGD